MFKEIKNLNNDFPDVCIEYLIMKIFPFTNDLNNLDYIKLFTESIFL